MGDFERKNDLAWRELLERHDILARIERDGFFVISAKQIKTLREPRLMAKFDHALNLPAVFKKHGLGILPVSRGEYILSHFHCYMPVPPASGPIVRMPFPHDLNSIDPIAITSEAVAVNCAAAAGIFAEFLEADRLTPTVSGRMGSGAF